jgi:hypothetical protein
MEQGVRKGWLGDAIRVEQQPDDAAFETGDTRHASVRWVVNNGDGALAIGPRRVDPRTGEILDADIEIEDSWTRLPRRVAREQLPPPTIAALREGNFCDYGNEAVGEMEFALDVLAARGDIEPGSPEAEAYVRATLKDVVTHEVGHALGLQHNFRASTIYTQAQQVTAALGISAPPWTGPTCSRGGAGRTGDIGPYDYWAIEYHRPLPGPGKGRAGPHRRAQQGDELAFANDRRGFRRRSETWIGGQRRDLAPTR